MAEKKEEDFWVNWVQKKLGDNPTSTNKFGLMAQEYAFYRGDQYRVWDQRLGILRQVNIAREARCIYNVCRPFVNMFVAKMLKGDPEPRFLPYPDNTEENDKNLTIIGNGMSQYWWKTAVSGSAKLRHQCQWGGITGIGIGKLYYNKDKQSGIYQGEIDFDTVNPFHFFCNYDARNDDEMRWAVERFPKEKSVVEEEFGLKKDSLIADEKRTIEEKRLAGGIFVDNYVSEQDESTVFVHDIWIKACKEYPLKWVAEKDEFGQPAIDENGEPKGKWTGGKHVVVAGGETLVEEDNSEPDMLPFFTFRVKSLPDELYGDGILKDILTPQRDMNRIESIVQGNAAFMGNGKWMVNRNSNVPQTALNNEEMERVDYDGEAPKRDQGVPVPEQIANRWWDLYRKMQTITGLQDNATIPYRGSQTSPGVMKELKSSEDVIFAQEVAEMSDYVRRIMRRFFFLAKKYYTEDRVIDIVGENKRPEVVTFNAQEFVKDPDFDISVGSGFSQSQEAKMDQMIQFAQTGIFERIPNFDWESFGKQIMEYGGLNKLSEDTFRDERQAKANLQLVLMGEQAPHSKYANFEAHIKVFTDYTKTPEYRTQDAQVRADIDKYIDECNQILQERMMQQMMQEFEMQQMQQQMMPPKLGPGNQKPQRNTATEEMEAGAARSQGTGQPVSDMNQPM